MLVDLLVELGILVFSNHIEELLLKLLLLFLVSEQLCLNFFLLLSISLYL
jgi:hypothetical protein